MNDRLYLLKIKLVDIEPEIYRHFVVPADITLDRLHDVIQIVMGWKDAHLHGFSINAKMYQEHPESKDDGADENLFRLGDLINAKGRTFNYLYDFGDCWEHDITILNNNYADPESKVIVECLEGAGACPPEDVGGVPGYFEFCQVLKDPHHKEHENYKTWYAGFPWYNKVFNSEHYDIENVNCELLKYLRWSRERVKPWNNAKPAR
jgi:hypothetical protein